MNDPVADEAPEEQCTAGDVIDLFREIPNGPEAPSVYFRVRRETVVPEVTAWDLAVALGRSFDMPHAQLHDPRNMYLQWGCRCGGSLRWWARDLTELQIECRRDGDLGCRPHEVMQAAGVEIPEDVNVLPWPRPQVSNRLQDDGSFIQTVTSIYESVLDRPGEPGDPARGVGDLPGRAGEIGRHLLTAAGIADLAPPSWLVEEYLTDGSLAVLWGDPGSYKSFLALDWALCVATGTPWLGRRVRTGRVLYVAGEGATGFRQRVPAWEQARGVPAGAGFHLYPRGLDLRSEEDAVGLIEVAERLTPSLVVFDTLARMHTGDENSTQDMSLVIQTADALREATGCAVLFVHHANKSGGYRGSSALLGASDAFLEAQKGPGGRLTLRCNKQKDAPEANDVGLLLSPVGESLAIFEGVSPSLPTGPTDPKDVLLAYLRAHPGWHSGRSLLANAKGSGAGTRPARDLALQALVGVRLVEKEPSGTGYRYRLAEPEVA